MTRLRVHLSTKAAEQLAGLHRRRRGMLEREIEKIAASTPGSRSPAAPDGQLVQIRPAMDVAAGEVIDDGKVLLVYAVLSRQELLRRICGTSLDRRLASRHMARVMRKRA